MDKIHHRLLDGDALAAYSKNVPHLMNNSKQHHQRYRQTCDIAHVYNTELKITMTMKISTPT